MFAKSILFSILFYFCFSINTNNTFSSTKESSAYTTYSYTSSVLKQASYTYERVLIDGVWWIIVYDEDGKIIDTYIDPEQV